MLPGMAGRLFLRRYLVALLVATLAAVGAVVGVNTVINDKIDRIPRVNLVTAPDPPGGSNFVLLGSDSRAFVKSQGQADAFGSASSNGGARSDTLMIVHIQPAAQKTLIVSIPRDTWVKIPGHSGMSKINAAFNDGPQAVLDTITTNFGVKVSHFMDVDFESFQGIVDAIGDVKVYIPYPVRDRYTGLHLIVGGCYPLNGSSPRMRTSRVPTCRSSSARTSRAG